MICMCFSLQGSCSLRSEDTQVMVEIMSEVLSYFWINSGKKIPVETANLLPRLEEAGNLFLNSGSLGEEIPMDELAKSNLPEM